MEVPVGYYKSHNNLTRGRVREGPIYQLGTLSTRIANLLCMTLVNVVTWQQQKTSALGKPDVNLFTARTDRHATNTSDEAKVTVPS